MEIERSLEALRYNGLEANFRCVVALGELPRPPYLRLLRKLERAIRQRPDCAKLHALKGKALLNLSEFSAASQALARSLRLDSRQAMAHAWLGEVHLSQGRFPEALEHEDAALKIDPGCAWARFYRAASRFGLGRKEAAREDIEHALELGGDREASLCARSFLALLEAQEGRFESAEEALRRVVAQSGGRGAAYRLSALVHEQQGAAERAIEDLAGVIEAEGPRAELFLRRANLAGGRKLYAQAVIDFEKALGLEPASKPVRGLGLSLARALGEEGKHAEAKRLLLKMAKRLPKDGEILLILAQHAERTGRAREASRRLKEAAAALGGKLSRDGKDPREWLVLAKVLFQLKRLQEAEAAARRALKRDPGWQPATALLADILVQAGRHSEAENILRQALRRRPESEELGDALANVLIALGKHGEAEALLRSAKSDGRLAHVLIRQGKLKAAEAVLRAALRRQPAAAGLAQTLAEVLTLQAKAAADSLIKQGKLARAEAVLRRALGREPLSGDIRRDLAKVLIDQEKLIEAEALLRGEPGRAGAAGEFAGMLGDVLVKLGKFPEAEAVLRRALVLAPKSSEVRGTLAVALIKQGKPARAQALLRQALAACPHNAPALLAWARLKIAAGKLEEAALAYGRAQAACPRRQDIVLQRSEILLRMGKTGEMLKTLTAALKETTGTPSAELGSLANRYALAVSALDFEEAALVGERILDKTKRNSYINNLRNSFFLQEFGFLRCPAEYKQRAAESLNRYAAAHPRSPWGGHYAAVLKHRIEIDADSEASVKRILGSSDERYGWMRYSAGHYFLTAGDFPKAIEEFGRAVRFSEPGDWVSQCHVGEAFACQDDKAGALKAFKLAARLAPAGRAGEVMAWKGEVLLWLGDYARALETLESCRGYDVRYAWGWRGGALVKLKRYGQALDCLDRAVALVPHDVEARIWRAEALYRLGRFGPSLRELNFAESRYGRYCNFYLYALRGLIHHSLGNPKAMDEDFALIPPEVVRYVRKNLVSKESDSRKETAGVLGGILELSRGVRHGAYEVRSWMR